MGEFPLLFPQAAARRLDPHLPSFASPASPSLPFVTLTFATSLDSALSLGPGIRTALSGPQSKAMTHYIRSRHDAICVGVGTAIADDPGLNCRIATTAHPPDYSPGVDTASVGALLGLASLRTGEAGISEADNIFTSHQPRPVVIDPGLRWDFTPDTKVMRLAKAGSGLAPYIITAVSDPPPDKRKLLEELGGKYIVLTQLRGGGAGAGPASRRRFDWRSILTTLRGEGLQSIMVEGGGEVINSLLSRENSSLVDSVIVTIAPTWLGQGSVFVAPPRTPNPDGQLKPVARLTSTTWLPLGNDVVLCGRIATQA
ncbi:putative riboflavin biosynthesis protein Rib7 [Durotheca rogersii]|uniref:putative riboflavin biosynthesis protein Rib7 n=1 Tax=Durotheca rogersii TaxID=419775 RepID=UPI00222043C2|nr:putative riboflavin biosynthesis protein Rib7 [Durotheca rogersii]KAI5868525.1 putative riboflavin biosynthesis protein Rib7 [Durotheca rogersii]